MAGEDLAEALRHLDFVLAMQDELEDQLLDRDRRFLEGALFSAKR